MLTAARCAQISVTDCSSHPKCSFCQAVEAIVIKLLTRELAAFWGSQKDKVSYLSQLKKRNTSLPGHLEKLKDAGETSPKSTRHSNSLFLTQNRDIQISPHDVANTTHRGWLPKETWGKQAFDLQPDLMFYSCYSRKEKCLSVHRNATSILKPFNCESNYVVG